MGSEKIVEIFDLYTENIRREYATGSTTENSYRPALKKLFEDLAPGTIAVNEPKRQEVGAPDFQIENAENHMLRENLIRQEKLFSSPPLAFVEHKDLDENLDKPEHQAQLKRYLRLGNVLHTNGLTFRFYIKDQKPIEVLLAELTVGGKIVVDSAKYSQVVLAYKQLLETSSLTIHKPLKLATLMAERAQAIRDIIEAALNTDIEEGRNTELTSQFGVFKEQLLHDLDEHKFADLYAQTLAYGLFAARYSDDSLDEFSLKEAADILPPTNRFLRRFFQEIAGYERENRINWVLDNLVSVFNRADVKRIMKGAGEEWVKNHDPIIHFYETFLELYDKKLKKDMGVYYTPQPVVKYIVNAVNEILKKDFGIVDGLSSTQKIEQEFKAQPITKTEQKRGYKIGKRQVHKVQILDPALGTGTFLNEVVKYVGNEMRPKLGTGWSKYVEADLLPRLYGFELMMAPYAMAHLRLNMTLSESGYKPISGNARLQVLLTNALEEPNDKLGHQIQFTGFQQILASEAQEADVIKTNHNVMVVIGNPPYSVSSNNKGKYIEQLLNDYKKGVTTTTNTQPLSDDYLKFLRFAQHMIIKNGQGVVAYICNRSFIEGIVHHKVRESMLNSFDKIYVYDLNGDSTINQALQQSNDENVFKIKQGVCIVVLIKNNYRVHNNAQLYYKSIRGKRNRKLKILNEEKLNLSSFKRLTIDNRYNFFISKDLNNDEYEQYASLGEIFRVHSSAIATSDDNKLIAKEPDVLRNKKFYYRPFDVRYINYDLRLVKGNRYNKLVKHLMTKDLTVFHQNYLLTCSKNITTPSFSSVLMSDQLTERKFSDYSRGPHLFPLYIYHSDGTRISNFDPKILKEFTINLNRKFNPENILDYIYAVLYSPKYREKFKEFLKIDFPRIPTPKNDIEFTKFSDFGKQLRELHLMTSPKLITYHNMPTGEGNWVVEKVEFELTDDEKINVFVNKQQYFANVPRAAWEFYIGGYQPAQKWLKDRKGRELSTDDLIHYQKIIAVLSETAKIMTEIDT